MSGGRWSFVSGKQCLPGSGEGEQQEILLDRQGSDNDIETYRDVLFYVGQVLGGFFVINRAGELELRKYGNTPVLTVERKHRFSSSFSDFITRYTAVSSTNLRTQIAEYYALDPDTIGNPALDVGDILLFSGG